MPETPEWPPFPKYAVVKWGDWDDIQEFVGADLEKYRIKDAEVIRHQDITAAPIFFTYSSILTSYVELLLSSNSIDFTRASRLRGIADYFHDAGMTASELKDRKLPD